MIQDSEYRPELYDDIAAGLYDQVYAHDRGLRWFWHHYRFAAVVDLMPSAGDSILDVGCGPGTFLGRHAEGYRHGVGIDVARAQIDYATETYGSDRLEFRTATLEQFGDSEFDVITTIEVIEHLPREETQTFLRSLFRVVKSGGTIVITTPNYRSLWPAIEWAISRAGSIDYTVQHINPFDVARLTGEIEAAGFSVTAKRTFFVVAPFLAPISRRLAEFAHAGERRLLPHLGSEIVVSAYKR